MDEMNEHEISRQIEKEVSAPAGLVALTVCGAVILGILVAGAVILIRQIY